MPRGIPRKTATEAKTVLTLVVTYDSPQHAFEARAELLDKANELGAVTSCKVKFPAAEVDLGTYS